MRYLLSKKLEIYIIIVAIFVISCQKKDIEPTSATTKIYKLIKEWGL